jgi:lysophospholipase L1-like esterase
MRSHLAALAFFAAALPCAAQTNGNPLRIMIIGDSITEGDNGGYRAPLFELITDAAGMPNFVGRRNARLSDPESMPDHDHEGYSAYRIDEIASGEGFWNAEPLETRLEDWDPAVVTIHAGTNDAQQNYHPFGDPDLGIPNVRDRLDSLVSRVVAYNPEIYVVVAQIVPANPPASETTIRYIERFNQHVPDVVARHQALGHRVSMVDLYTPMLPYPHPDGIHPSQEGFQVMADVLFGALRALGVLPANPDQGRDDGLSQHDDYSTSATPPWAPVPNLLRTALEQAIHQGYGGSTSPDVLTDGQGALAAHDRDNSWTSTFVFDTGVNAAGYDVTEVRTYAGGLVEPNGDEHAHQAYEVWYSTVAAPEEFVRLGDFHHIIVNEREKASRIALTRADGPVASGVKALQFRFEEPPLRQAGFIGIGNPADYREIESLGAPTARAAATAHATEGLPAHLDLHPATPNPFAGRTTLRVALPEAGAVRLSVHDVLGREVATLLEGEVAAGEHAVAFDAEGLPSGTDVARLAAGGRVLTRRVTLLR